MTYNSIRSCLAVFTASLLAPLAVSAQTKPDNVPAGAQNAANAVSSTVRRYGIGVEGGVALNPELIDVGVHANFGPLFHNNIVFRPGVELGFGELTTEFGINLDVLYDFPGATRTTSWAPYIGTGPNFALSHESFSGVGTPTNVNVASPTTTNNTRFDFSDTSFDAGWNFIAGVRRPNGFFTEMRATAWGVANVRLVAGFNF